MICPLVSSCKVHVTLSSLAPPAYIGKTFSWQSGGIASKDWALVKATKAKRSSRSYFEISKDINKYKMNYK